MTKQQSQPHLDAIRAKLLAPMLLEAAFDGWTDTGLQRAAKQAGLHPGEVELALPKGCIDLIRYWSLCNDAAMLAAWQAAKPETMRIREKAVFLVRARLQAIGEQHREAARRAAARLSLPGTQDGPALAWASADAMWRAMQDSSTDYNYYSKRAILVAVFASTFHVWLQGDDARTWAFLDRRIGNIMQFEGMKAKWRKRAKNWPDPAKLLGRLRYGRGRSRPRRM
ncbi:hypothetical protein MNBD_ALPHA06-446 [hydrothermal vent metagenome]|uniref:COQ9 C-terminal domain-containing protein n=1 Tax=hydrothermal vent metagenome TaxID=652676 RepID=A0A3B0RY99_9ZZZZ